LYWARVCWYFEKVYLLGDFGRHICRPYSI